MAASSSALRRAASTKVGQALQYVHGCAPKDVRSKWRMRDLEPATYLALVNLILCLFFRHYLRKFLNL
jgi:hypothetical protein